jgi:hypothetical protein
MGYRSQLGIAGVILGYVRMKKKEFSAEQDVGKLREAEVLSDRERITILNRSIGRKEPIFSTWESSRRSLRPGC